MENNIIKCSSIEHDKINAIVYCQECKVYMCNKCLNFHSNLLKNHHTNKIENDNNEIFSEFCKKENHFGKLEYFCKTHNELCCSDCLCKIKIEGKGEHFNCNVCTTQNIKNEKKNILEENIKILENLSNSIEKLLNEFKVNIEKINMNKEEIKLKIQNIFTKIRNALNEREDKLLLEVDKYGFKEDIEKDSLKLPNKINESLKKCHSIETEWNNEKKLLSLINDCVKIENNIKEINLIKENIIKSNNFDKICFIPKEDDDKLKKILTDFSKFGEIIEENKKKKVDKEKLQEIYQKLEEYYYITNFKSEKEVKQKIIELNYNLELITNWVESIM